MNNLSPVATTILTGLLYALAAFLGSWLAFRPKRMRRPDPSDVAALMLGQIAQRMRARLVPDGEPCPDCGEVHGPPMTYQFRVIKHGSGETFFAGGWLSHGPTEDKAVELGRRALKDSRVPKSNDQWIVEVTTSDGAEVVTGRFLY